MGTESYLAACTGGKLKCSKDPSVTPSGKSRAGIQTLPAFKHTETIGELSSSSTGECRSRETDDRPAAERDASGQGGGSGAEPRERAAWALVPQSSQGVNRSCRICEDEAFPLPEPDKITVYGQASPPARAGNLRLHSRGGSRGAAEQSEVLSRGTEQRGRASGRG